MLNNMGFFRTIWSIILHEVLIYSPNFQSSEVSAPEKVRGKETSANKTLIPFPFLPL